MALKSLLTTGARIEIGADNQAVVVGEDWLVPAVSDQQREWIARVLLPQYDTYLEPARGDDLAARITVLLSHYFVADLPPAAHAALLRDWVRSLAGLPMWSVGAACARWLAERDRKPSPAAIRSLAFEACADVNLERERLQKILALPAPPNVLMELLRGALKAHELAAWIKPLSVAVLNEGAVSRAIVRAPSAFHRDWVATRYEHDIRRVLKVDSVVFLMAGEPDPEPVEALAAGRVSELVAEAVRNLRAPVVSADGVA